MKKIGILVSLLMLVLTACSANEDKKTAVVYAVFSGNQIKEYQAEYSGQELTAEMLTAGLSEVTGLDFKISASRKDDGLIVDWQNDSTLIAGLDDREQKDEFHFFEANSLNWFMLDSLKMTLKNNLGVENIYYTMDNGSMLVVRELQPISSFPSDLPYESSEFYYSHYALKGDETLQDIIAHYQGFWLYPEGFILEMDEEIYRLYEDGTVIAEGNVKYSDDGYAYLLNADGSSGGGVIHFGDDGNLYDGESVLSYLGISIDNVPMG